MNKKVLGASAALVGVLGMLVRFGAAWVRGHLTPEALPGWAVFGTAGTSITTYTTVVLMAVSGLTVLVAVGVGYYLGRQYNIAREYRPFVETVALGSALGVGLVSLVTLWPNLSSIGGYTSTTSGAGAIEWLVMDVVLLGVVFLNYLVEVALVVTVGMLAGAALAQFRADAEPPAGSTDTDTTSLSASTSSPTDGPPESQSRPVQ